MKIDRALNFVIPVETGDATIYVHAMPIGRVVFERYFMVLSRTFSAIYTLGLGVTAGPRVAALMLKKIATESDEWDGPLGVERGLVAEIRRLANVVALGDKGWASFPLQEALDRKYLDEDDAAEVENALVFFTVASAMHRKRDLKGILASVGGLWGAQTSSLGVTAFASSLPTSTPDESTGAKAPTASLPPS